MQIVFIHLFTLMLLCLTASIGHAQSVNAEQAKLAKLERQNQNLIALNADINASLTAISAEIEQLMTTAPPNTELTEAEQGLSAAQATYTRVPSAINKDKLEIAEFKHALALRKYNKNNSALVSLKKEQEELNKAVKTNTLKIRDNLALIESQTALIDRLQTQAAKTKRIQQQAQQHRQQQAEQQALEIAEKERREALAEVARLRALLAQQEREREAAEQQRLTAEATTEASEPQANDNTDATNGTPESFVILTKRDDIAAEIERINTATALNSSGRKYSKFITIKTYNNKALIGRETKRLRHIGGDFYQSDQITIPVKYTEFVVGQNTWHVDLPELDPRTGKGKTSRYIITLDLRNSELPFLTIYPN